MERFCPKVDIGPEKLPKEFKAQEMLELYLQEKDKELALKVENEDVAIQKEIKSALNIRTFDEL